MPRVGTKRSDRRWQAPDGTIWASKFEYEVYEYIRSTGCDVRKCGEGDSLNYPEPKRQAECLACGGTDVVQNRVYTPDLFVTPPSVVAKGRADGYYLETKGYFRPEKRTLFRHFLKAWPNLDIRIVYEQDGKATSKLRNLQYAERYFKIPAVAGIIGLIESGWLDE